jgi:Tfp pilus assembly protein PilP
MPNHMKFCGCRHCRKGMRSKSEGDKLKKFVRKVRRSAKMKIKEGEEPEPKVSVPYTD